MSHYHFDERLALFKETHLHVLFALGGLASLGLDSVPSLHDFIGGTLHLVTHLEVGHRGSPLSQAIKSSGVLRISWTWP